MYQLGKQFEIDYTNIKPNDKSVIQGKKFRITVLTERVVRSNVKELLYKEINYEKVNSNLSLMRKKGMAYLMENIV